MTSIQQKNTKQINYLDQSAIDVFNKITKQQQQAQNYTTKTNNSQANAIKWSKILLYDIAQLSRLRSQMPHIQSTDQFNSRVTEALQLSAENLIKDFRAYQLVIVRLISALNDDHSSVSFTSNQEISRSNFTTEAIINNKTICVLIKQSQSKQLQQGDQIVAINGKSPARYLVNFSNAFLNKTSSRELNMKKAAIQIPILNPFNPIHTLTIERDNRRFELPVKYKSEQIPIDKLDAQLNRELMGVSIDKQVGVSIYEWAKMIHLEIHDFPMYGPQLSKIFTGLQTTKQYSELEWAIIDFRQNFGGSPISLVFIAQLLLNKSLVPYITSCRNNKYAIGDQFLDKYHKQFLQPILKDKHLDKNTRKILSKQLQTFQQANTNIYNEYATKKCSDNKLKQEIAKIAKQTLKNQTKKIIVVTDYMCFSACVWSVRFLSQFPNVVIIGKQVGQTTGSGNLLTFDSPSKIAQFMLPQLQTEINSNVNQIILNQQTQPDIELPEHLLTGNNILLWIADNKQKLTQIIQEKSIKITKQ